MTPRFITACAVALCVLALPAGALAQRALHWDNVEVAAHLDAEGRLLVTETQTMVFNGDWNGGERRFNIRPRQQLRLLGLDRADGGRSIPMVRDSSLDDVDDYAFTDDTTLRWRSRLPTDAPFANATKTYVLRYQLVEHPPQERRRLHARSRLPVSGSPGRDHPRERGADARSGVAAAGRGEEPSTRPSRCRPGEGWW